MKSIHVHTTNMITSLSPPRACSFSNASHFLCFVGWSLPPCRSACGRKRSDQSGPENKQGAWTRAISSRCASTKIGAKRSESAAAGRSGRILGLGIGPRIAGPGPIGVEVNGGGEDAVGGHRGLPPCPTKTWPAAVGKRTRTQPLSTSTVCARTWAPTA